MYLGFDVPTCLAEVFQEGRLINRSLNAPYLTGFQLARPLQLLDLTSTWPLHIGASNAINATDNNERTRQWARALRDRYPDADGLLHVSSLTGHRGVALFNPAESALPDRPQFSEPLDNAALADALNDAADQIGYHLL